MVTRTVQSWAWGSILSLGVLLQGSARAEEPIVKEPPPRIEMAILLDTSNSMDGLIQQAKTQLWKIVNEFATTQRNGQQPQLHVALYEYGNDSLSPESGHIRQVLGLTDNLDLVSEELFKLTTNGGSEYCGQVIEAAVKSLDWSESDQDLKCIFIAGNEPFTQGPVDYRAACQTAASKGITVSTIFCGDHQEGVSTNWQDGAKLADGSYVSINQDQVVPDIESPQDEELARLNSELNKTYLPYGDVTVREESLERQSAQDANATQSGSAVAAARVLAKASGLYRNTQWDLCDACRSGKVKLEDLSEDQLPEVLRKMKPDERKAYIEKMAKTREEVQKKIQELSAERDKYVAEQRRQLAEDSSVTLDAAIVEAVRKQADQKSFQFEK